MTNETAVSAAGMRVRVCYSITASTEYRMALRHHYGQHGTLATRGEVRQHLEMSGASQDDDLMQEWQDCDEGCQG